MDEIYIAIRDSLLPGGTGTRDDPYNGSTPALLDPVLLGITVGTTIRFGPGTFRTRGSGSWTPLSQQRLVGSGMFATVIQLVDAVPPNDAQSAPIPTRFTVIGSSLPVMGVEISDLTVDCNLARQPKPLTTGGGNPLIAINAIGFLAGTNITVQRVRIINWGTYTPFDPVPARTFEDFPIFIEGGVSGTEGPNVVQECIIEQPEFSNAREVTLLNNHARVDSPGVMTTVRRNYLNGDFTTGSPLAPEPLSSISYNNVYITVTTLYPHGLQAGDEILLQGAPAGFTGYNGRFPIHAIDNEMTIRIAQSGLPGAPGVAGLSARRYVREAMVVTLARSGIQVTVTTPAPHFRKPTDWVRIFGVKIGGAQDYLYYNGSFQVLASPAPTANTFVVQLWATPPANPDSGLIWLDRWSSQRLIISPKEGTELGLRGFDFGIGLVRTQAPHFKVPGDFVLIAGVGGPDAGPWNGYFKVTAVEGTRLVRVKLNISTKPNDVQHEAPWTQYPTAEIIHHFQGITGLISYGARVYGNRLIGLLRGGPYHDLGGPSKDLTTYYNYYYFCSVGQYSALEDGTADELWNVTRDNVIDLQPFAQGAWNHSRPGGVIFQAPFAVGSGDFPGFQTVITRDNIIRFVDWNGGPGGGQYGIYVQSAGQWVVEDNLITFTQATRPLGYLDVPIIPERNNIGMNGATLTPVSGP